MLKSVDVLLGVTVVMLIISVIVTALTQFVLHMRNARGRQLKEGIADLLGQIAPDFSRQCAEHIAGKVLLHPLVRQSHKRMSSAVHREDLVELILELATQDQGGAALDSDHRASLVAALQRDGISAPGQVLQNVRSLSLQLELNNPDLSNSLRSNIALIQEANSAFLGKIHAWFDQTIDRSIDRFTAKTRVVTFGCAFLVALALQLDTGELVNRLAADDELRNKLVERAMALDGAGAPGALSPSTPVSEAQSGEDTDALLARLKRQKEAINDLAQIGAIDIPQSWGDYWGRWQTGSFFPKLIGILLSTVLLSFGAPFWYNALKNLLKLRSVIAGKDDNQRQERQTIATSVTPAGTIALSRSAVAAGGATHGSSGILHGERGYMGPLG